MSIRQFQQELSKGLPSPNYLLYSVDDFLLYEALSLIKERHQGGDVFNFDIFDYETTESTPPAEQVIDLLNTLPLMAPRRTVVMRNMQKLPKKDIKKLATYVPTPSETSLLVMLYLGKAPELFEASVLKKVKTIPLNLPEKDIPSWIKEKGKSKGLMFTDRAVEYLLNSVGTDLGMLYSEIEKCEFLGARVIDLNDVKGILYAGIEYTAFDLVDALKKGEEREVFRIFEHLARSMDPQMLLGALNWQYARQWSASSMEGGGKGSKRFQEIFRLLHEADAAIKTSHSYVLEDLLIKLLKTPSAS